MEITKRFSQIFFILCLSLTAWAFKAPPLTSPVMDQAGLLSRKAVQEITKSLFDFKDTQGSQIQVFITPTLGDEPIESVAIQIFDQWKLGSEKGDNGILFLVAANERRMRIEVGQGLEGDVPDVIAKRIIGDIVTPFFKRGEYDMGVYQGVAALQKYISSSPEQKAELKQNLQSSGESKGEAATKKYGFFIILGIWLLLFIFNPGLAINLLFFALARGGGGISGGGGRGWGGGGGRSSGGGASGGW